MIACGYCGRDNDDTATHCRECGTEFPVTTPPLPEGPPNCPNRPISNPKRWKRRLLTKMVFTGQTGISSDDGLTRMLNLSNGKWRGMKRRYFGSRNCAIT